MVKSEEFMKTNAMTKTKEEELSEWIERRMKYDGASGEDLPWVAMDKSARMCAYSERPCKVWGDGTWVAGSGDFLDFGYLPDELRIWPWHEFLLQWGPKPLTPDTSLVRHSLGEGGSPTPDLAPGRMERAVQVLRRLTTEPSPPLASPLITDHCTLNTPPFQRCVWAADVMSEAYRITVAIVEEPLPSPQEVPHWRLPTDEELDRLLPGGWTERCPLDL